MNSPTSEQPDSTVTHLILIRVDQLVDDAELDDEDLDQGIPGEYLVRVASTEGDDPLEQALDVFHESIGIATLDNYSIDAAPIDPSQAPPGARELDGAGNVSAPQPELTSNEPEQGFGL